MSTSYGPTSPYALTKQNSWYLDIYKHRPISVNNGDRAIVIGANYNHRPDLLAFDLYGSPHYWWVFLVRNMNIIRDPIWDFKTGTTIYVPSAAHLKAVVG